MIDDAASDPAAERRKRHAAHQRAWRERHPERVREVYRRHRDRHLEELRKAGRERARIDRRDPVRKLPRVKYKHARYAKTAFAENHQQRWSTEEIKLIFDCTKTDLEISALIGRSLAAITLARRRYKTEYQPADWKPKGTPRIEDNSAAGIDPKKPE